MAEKEAYTDEEILASIQAGGIEARRMTEYLFDQYSGYIVKGSRTYRLALEDARDVYADAIVAMNRQISSGKFRGESKLSTYLYSIFMNRCKNKIRDNKRKEVDWADEMPEMPEKAKGILQKMIAYDEVQRVRDALVQLGETCRKIIWDREFFGYSLEEIAERIGFSNVRSVSSKKASCLKRLRELLKQSNPHLDNS